MYLLLVLVLVGILGPRELLAGDNVILSPEFEKRVTTTLLEQEPQWQVKHSATRINGLVQRWVRREVEAAVDAKSDTAHGPAPEVLVQVGDHGSPEAAAEQLRTSVRMSSVRPVRSKEAVGDEAFVWDSYGPRGESGIRIRKGSVLIYVNGPTLDLTMRFAKRYLKDVESQLAR